MVCSNDRCIFCCRTRTQAGPFVEGGPADALVYICKDCTDATLRMFREFTAREAVAQRRRNRDIIKIRETT